MFRFHDRTRRRICRAGFVLLCLVPTVVVSAWCLWRHRPGHVDAEARRLGRELGLDVSIDGLKHIRPGSVRYEGLELSDPETGQPVFRCRLLEAGWGRADDVQGQSRPRLRLVCRQAEIEATAADRLRELLQRLLRRPAAEAEDHVELLAAEVTLRTEDHRHELGGLHGRLDTLPGGARIQLGFRIADADVLEPVRIDVVRNRQTTPAATGFELDTGGTAVPCGVLALGLPGVEELGARCRFRGYIWAQEAADESGPAGWDGYLTGQLTDVDFGRLVSDRFPHQLAGTGLVSIQSARIVRGRLEEAEGELHVGPGVIGRKLMAAAVQRLHLIEGAEPATSGDPVPYEQLALAVVIDRQGIQLHGRCRRAGLDAILVDRSSRLLSEPVFQPQPVAALLQALVPTGGPQVSATRQTEWLMRHLPVPGVAAAQRSAAALPEARLESVYQDR